MKSEQDGATGREAPVSTKYGAGCGTESEVAGATTVAVATTVAKSTVEATKVDGVEATKVDGVIVVASPIRVSNR